MNTNNSKAFHFVIISINKCNDFIKYIICYFYIF